MYSKVGNIVKKILGKELTALQTKILKKYYLVVWVNG
jgi:hypothetical protein